MQPVLEGSGQSKELQSRWIPYVGRGKGKKNYPKEPPMITGRSNEISKVMLDKSVLDNAKHDEIITSYHFH